MAEVIKQDPRTDQRGDNGNDPHRRPALDLLNIRDAMITFRHLAAPFLLFRLRDPRLTGDQTSWLQT
ncbi:hypothetical protein D3C71_2041340 [compost metagenome]